MLFGNPSSPKLMIIVICVMKSICGGGSSSSSTTLSQWIDVDKSACDSAALRRHRKNKIQIGVILPFSGDHPYRINLTRPAVEYARDYVLNKTDLLRNFTIDFDYRDSQCSETYGPLEAIDMYTKKSADLFLGPACDYAIAVIARFTQTWGIPIMSAGAQPLAFSDKTTYGLLTRLLGSHKKSAEFVVDVLKHFHYKNIGMLYHENRDDANEGRSECFFIMEPIFVLMQQAINSDLDLKSHVEQYTDDSTPSDLERSLKDLSQACRVIILCASPHSVREIMIKAHDLNFDNGEYVFFNIDLFTSKNSSERPWYNASDTEPRNEKAKKAYEALMTVTLRKPTNKTYMDFSRDVKNRAKKLYDNFTYGEDEPWENRL